MAFLVERAVYLVVVDMSLGLDEKIETFREDRLEDLKPDKSAPQSARRMTTLILLPIIIAVDSVYLS